MSSRVMRIAMLARERIGHRASLRVGGRIRGVLVARGEALLQERGDALGDGEERESLRARRVGSDRLDPLGDSLHALGDVDLRLGGGGALGEPGLRRVPDARFGEAKGGLLLLPHPLGAADPRLLRDGAREHRAEHALEGTDRQREQLEDAVRIARLVGELEGEREKLHRGAPPARPGVPLVRERVLTERGLERRSVVAADDDGVVAMLGEERRGELGEIARRIATEEEKRAVSRDRGALPGALRRALAPQHLLQDAEVGRGGSSRELEAQRLDARAALLEEREDRAPAQRPESALLDEHEAVVEANLRGRAKLVLDPHHAIGAAERERLGLERLERGERLETVPATGNGLTVPAGLDELVTPGEERLRRTEGIDGERVRVEGSRGRAGEVRLEAPRPARYADGRALLVLR